jgi:hypothetical protein
MSSAKKIFLDLLYEKKNFVIFEAYTGILIANVRYDNDGKLNWSVGLRQSELEDYITSVQEIRLYSYSDTPHVYVNKNSKSAT